MIRVVIAVLLLGCLHGCSGGEPTIANRAAFDQAVQAYLDERGMDLKIVEYMTFESSADAMTARAKIKMGYAGPAVNAKTRFLFEFANVNGTWRVTTHKDAR